MIQAHKLGHLVLKVEERGHRPRRPRESRMGGHVAHALAAHPDLAVILQALEKFLARPCRHAADPATKMGSGLTLRHRHPPGP